MAEFNRFVVCFIDVLGFELRFEALGLRGMLERYVQLVQIVNDRNAQTERWFGEMNFTEGAYWVANADVFISARIYGAYASDLILLFAHADFPENRYPQTLTLSPQQREAKALDPATGWMYHAIPCDSFLEVCNEVLCYGIELGLPLRGALSMGEAVLHLDRGIYLGNPLIETARLEHSQLCIGASFAKSFMSQTVPKRYQLPFRSHFKANVPETYAGAVLDWPRRGLHPVPKTPS